MRGKLSLGSRQRGDVLLPSMRPALYARETDRNSLARSDSPAAFNEARALCAGNFMA